MKRLNSDELGEKGESMFPTLCVDAKLVCNASRRDRTGWDFIVEAPFGKLCGGPSLDQRDSPLSCHVQVKTIWTNSKRLRLPLSSAEYLAKEPKPTFVYVFVVDEHLVAVQSYLIHIRGQNLERILRRLREVHATGQFSLNETVITFDPTQGCPLSPTGAALREQLERECGPDPHAYVLAKAEEKQKLGFENGRYELNLTFDAVSVDDLIDGFLGLRPLDVSAFESTEVRFGVPLSTDHVPKDATVRVQLQPQAAERCSIRLYGENDAPPAVFSGEVFFSPIRVPGAPVRAHIKTTSFTLDYHGSLAGDGGRLTFETLPQIADDKFSIQHWKNHFRLLTALASDKPYLEISPDKEVRRIRVPLHRHVEDGQFTVAKDLLHACENAERILELAGACAGRFSWDEIVLLADEIRKVSWLLQHKPEVAAIAFTTEHAGTVGQHLDLLYVSWIQLDQSLLVYGAVLTMAAQEEADRLTWRPTAVRQARVAEVRNSRASYDCYVSEFKAASGGIVNTAIREFEQPLSECAQAG